MEGSRKSVNKHGPVSGASSERSVDNTSTCVSAKAKSGRVRLQMRTLNNYGDSRSYHKMGPFVVYENTYKLEPDDNMQFSTQRVEQTIGGIFEQYLHNAVYDPNYYPRLVKTLSDVIKDRVKTQYPNRYKIITTVTVIQRKEQGVQISGRALWNHSFDNYATLTYEGSNFIAVGTVYCVYQD